MSTTDPSGDEPTDPTTEPEPGQEPPDPARRPDERPHPPSEDPPVVPPKFI